MNGADEHTTGYTYDELGRTISATDANGGILTFVYDGNNVLMKGAEGGKYFFTYDEMNCILTENDPEGQ